MKELVRPVLLWSLLAFVMALLGFATSYHVPQLKNWILNEITIQAKDRMQISVLAAELNFTVLPLGIELKDIHVLPRADHKDPYRRIYIRRLAAGLDPLSLIAGNFGLSLIEFEGSDIQLQIPGLSANTSPEPTAKKTRASFMKEWIQRILKIPVHFLRLKDTRIAILGPENENHMEAKGIDLEIENRFKQLQIEIQVPSFEWTEQAQRQRGIQLKVAARGVLAPNQSYLQSLRIESGDSFAEVSGRFQGEKQQFRFQKENIDANADVDLSLLKPVIRLIDPSIAIPDIAGRLSLDLHGGRGMDTPLQIQGIAKGKDLFIKGRALGNINAPIVYRDQVLMSPGISLSHPAGAVNLKQVRVSFEPEIRTQATLDVQQLELAQLLKSVGAGSVPLLMNLKGLLDCEGTITRTPIIECAGKVNGSDFVVWSGRRDNLVVSLPLFQVEGKVKVDNTGVFPSGTIRLPQSEGKAEGQVLFATGFMFKFSSEGLNLKDLASVAGLKLEGQTALTGKTQGDSASATVNFETQTKDLWISDFGLGNVKSNGGYESGTLSFHDIEGNFRSSRYRGDISLLLYESRIQGQVTSQLLEMNDLQRLLSRKADLPIQGVGLGRAEAKFEGPFDFTRLSYTMNSSFQSGSVDNENFQELHFDVLSQNGNVRTQRALIKKGRGSIQMKADVSPDGILQANVKSTDLTIQDFQVLSDLGLNVTGTLSSEINLKGPILRPQFQMRNRLSETYIGDQPVADSEAAVLWNRELISMEVRLLGKSLIAEATFPRVETIPFQFHIATERFNFAPLFGLLNSNSESRDFQGLLTMEGDLRSEPGGGFWTSKGSIRVGEFALKKDRLSLAAKEPLDLAFSGNHVSSNTWTLKGDQTDLKLKVNPSTENALDFQVQGGLELSLISFLTPFLEDLRGVLSGGATFKGSLSQPNWSGSFKLQQGYVRLKEFIHSFENLSADLSLYRNLVTIENLLAQFGGGKLTGAGNVELVHLNELPLDIKGALEGVSLNVPAGVATTGDGNYRLTGSWFPFLLQGTYRIRDGVMTKNLDAEETQNVASKRRSSLLPQFLTTKDMEPLNFNLNVQFPQGFKVRNNLVDLVANGELQIRGSSLNPILNGEVLFRKGGKLFFRDTPFDIQVGSLKFNDPKENNPYVYISGTTRLTQTLPGRTGFFDLSMLAQGNAKNMSIQLRSQPPLPEQDIISLLALGVTTNEIQNQARTGANTKELQNLENRQNYELGSAILSQSPVGKEIRKRTGFDVKFSSAVDQVDYEPLPRIVLSKQWNPKVKTSASRTIGTRVLQDVKLEYQLNNSLSVIGSWNGRAVDEGNNVQSGDQDFFGLDLQYKVEFK